MPDDSSFLSPSQFDPPALLVFVAVEIALGSGFLRLVDGSGEVSFAARTFVGLDPVFGVLANLEAVTDGMGAEAPALNVGINPPTANAAAILAGEDMQGRSVLVWLGTLNPQTGVVTPDPVLVFVGEVDQGVLNVGTGSRGLALNCVSIWERLFDDAQGVRLSNAYHQSAWPGELGFEYVTAVQRQLPWGSDAPRPNVVSDAVAIRL
jgi:hypothetical protein